MRYALRRDENETAIEGMLNAHGYQTWTVDCVPFDMIVWKPNVKAWLLLELKTDRGRLTKQQQRFFDLTQGLPRAAVKTPETALEAAKHWLGV